MCTPVYTGEVDVLCLPYLVCDVVVGNIPGVHPEIIGDAGCVDSCEPAEEEILLEPMASDSVVGGAVETSAQIRRKERPVKTLKVEGLGATSE